MCGSGERLAPSGGSPIEDVITQLRMCLVRGLPRCPRAMPRASPVCLCGVSVRTRCAGVFQGRASAHPRSWILSNLLFSPPGARPVEGIARNDHR